MVKSRIKLLKKQTDRPMLLEKPRKGLRQSNVTLEDYFQLHDEFIKAKVLEGLASRTLLDHKRNIKYLEKYINLDPQDFDNRCVCTDVFRSYISYMILEKKYKPCTTNTRIRTLKCYLKWLYEEEYIDYDYSKKLKLVKVPQDTIKPLSDSETRKMLKQPNRETFSGFRDFVLMVLFLDCGIRVSEALNLKKEDIDLSIGLIGIKPEIAKTRVFRQIPISKKTCKIMSDLMDFVRDDCPYVFQTCLGEKISTNTVIHQFIEYGRNAGIDKRCTPHVWRHTFARNFVKANGDIFTLQKILGHTTMDMCRKYIQLDSTDLRQKHDQVGLLNNFIR